MHAMMIVMTYGNEVIMFEISIDYGTTLHTSEFNTAKRIVMTAIINKVLREINVDIACTQDEFDDFKAKHPSIVTLAEYYTDDIMPMGNDDEVIIEDFGIVIRYHDED